MKSQKCATLVMRLGKKVVRPCLALLERPIMDLGNMSYRDSEVLETDKIRIDKMKTACGKNIS